MTCQNPTLKSGTDSLEFIQGIRPFDHSPSAWLLGEAVRFLNTAGKEGEFQYSRIVEILRCCAGDLLETVTNVFHQVKGGDASLRWNLLYILGDAGDEHAADFLCKAVLRQLPERRDETCCESERDLEVLVATGAVHALHKLTNRYPNAAELILKIIAERPARPILVETVKVVLELDLKERVIDLLSKDDHWILDLRRVRPQELFVEPEREDGMERRFTPPKYGGFYTAPKATCCHSKEN